MKTLLVIPIWIIAVAAMAQDYYTGLKGGWVIRTNFVSGQLYTNNWKQTIRVEAGISNVVAASAGTTKLELWVYPQIGSGTQGNTNSVETIHQATIGPWTNKTTLGDDVAPGFVWTYTNLSSGPNNFATPYSGKIKIP